MSSRIPPGVRIATTLGEAVQLNWLSNDLFLGVEKFGQILDYASADGNITIWSGAGGTYTSDPQLPDNTDVPVDPGTTDTGGLTPAKRLYVMTPQAGYIGILTVQGLGLGGVFQSTQVVCNGTTASEILDSLGQTLYWTRVFRAWVENHGGGSSLTNVIYITSDSSGPPPPTANTTWAMIENSLSLFPNQTLMAYYAIPAGWSGYIAGYTISLNRQATPQNREANFGLYTKERTITGLAVDQKPWRARHVVGLSSQGASTFTHRFPVGIQVPELSEVRLMVQGSANDLDFTGSFSLFLKR